MLHDGIAADNAVHWWEAAHYCDKAKNAPEIASILGIPEYLDVAPR
jgi:hypothetical protein